MTLEVLAPLSPLATLARRSPTLEGSVPLRVAQACQPLLEGNAFGFQVRFEKPLVARTRLGRPSLVKTAELEEVVRMHRASARYLVEHGIVRGPWAAFLARGGVTTERGRLRIWTGLCVKAPAGHWLRVSGTRNRGPRGLDADEVYVLDDGAFVPLVIDFVTPPGETRLVGEVATVAVVRPGVRVEIVPIADASHLARAHAAFYDDRYFAKKRDEAGVTRKYRRTVGRASLDGEAHGGDEVVSMRVAHIAGPAPAIEHDVRVLSAGDTKIAKRRPPRPFDRVHFDNAVGFTARWDGYSLVVDPDARALASGARDVEAAMRGPLGGAESRGALLYLTKYFTPHPRGEPHFFVKPWAFVETAPGWSSLLEGPRGERFDVLRGVVHTDAFHAVPAVFQLHDAKPIELARGEHLLEVVAVPRATLGGGVRVRAEAP
jgi:hypothetical protein